MLKNLIFLTAHYPNNRGESFVENEIRYLEKRFSHIYIICTTTTNNTVSRYLPTNAKVFTYNDKISTINKLTALLSGLFSSYLKEELNNLPHCHLTSNKKIKKIALIDLFKGRQVFKIIGNIIKAQQLNPSETLVYSYWNDFKAIGASLAKDVFPGLTMVTKGHRWDVYFELNPNSYLPFRSLIFDRADRVFFISENGKNYTLNYSPYFTKFENKFQVARLGTLNPHRPVSKKPPEECFLFISCAQIYYIKRVELLAQALGYVKDIKIRWVHFGAGLTEQDFYQLQTSAEECLKDRPNIEYCIHGFIANQELFDFYSKHDVDLFINTSISEGIPVSIMEAMSFGIPVMATDVGGTSEIVTHERNGILLPKELTPIRLANEIVKFLNKADEEKAIFRQNAFNTWNQHYNADQNYRQFIQTITKLKHAKH